MKRNSLLTLLDNYIPTPEEASDKQDMLQFAKENVDCFERSLLSGHFTASAWLLNKDRSKVLLMHHVKLGIWCQLGGHCDGDPDILKVAIKEAQEESGILGISPVHDQIFDIDIHQIPVYKQIPAHLHYDVRFLLQVTSDEDFIRNQESHELRWVGKNGNDLPELQSSELRMFQKWLLL